MESASASRTRASCELAFAVNTSAINSTGSDDDTRYAGRGRRGFRRGIYQVDAAEFERESLFAKRFSKFDFKAVDEGRPDQHSSDEMSLRDFPG